MKRKLGLSNSTVVEKVESARVISERSYYGVVFSSNVRGFISREHYDAGNFIVSAQLDITNGNRHVTWSNSNLSLLIVSLLFQGIQVFEFTSSQELFKWLAEDTE